MAGSEFVDLPVGREKVVSVQTVRDAGSVFADLSAVQVFMCMRR